MSFFNDFVKSLSIDDVKNQICCDLILGVALKVSANFKIEDLSENEIILNCKKKRIKITGSELEIVSLAKGELEIVGNIDGVVKI